jgi:hypothetical protein|tara:strand:- start:1876 stop:2316 length:441 start_codon:yes stop_codon:yes gene_type:complete
MKRLNFPNYEFRLKKEGQKRFIFDLIRKKYVQLSSEEWVRQNCIRFLIEEKRINKYSIAIEKEIEFNGIKKRFDIVSYSSEGKINLLVECKAPNIEINQKTFDQILIYNKILKSKYLMVTNGINHYYCKINEDRNNIKFLANFPLI